MGERLNSHAPSRANREQSERVSPPDENQKNAVKSESRLKSREELLDDTVEDSFPASDPPSQTPITGH